MQGKAKKPTNVLNRNFNSNRLILMAKDTGREKHKNKNQMIQKENELQWVELPSTSNHLPYKQIKLFS